MTEELSLKLKRFARSVANLIAEHRLDGSVTVAMGTRIEGKTYLRSVGNGGIQFEVKQPEVGEWKEQN